MGPIGIFDSGYGGLTILSKIRALLPKYDYIYLGDNARNPYGSRSFDVVHQYTWECVKYLFDQGCNIVILACNTASAKALRTIQQNQLLDYDPTRRVLGVIRPTVEQIDSFTISNNVGLFATIGTIQSESYQLEVAKLFPQIKVIGQACPMWVPLIENNEHLDEGADYFVVKYLNELLEKDKSIDSIILGCTHYPLIEDKIRFFLNKMECTDIKLISQGDIIANSLLDYFMRHPDMEMRCSKNSTIRYLTTESAEKFQQSASTLIFEDIIAEKVDIG